MEKQPSELKCTWSIHLDARRISFPMPARWDDLEYVRRGPLTAEEQKFAADTIERIGRAVRKHVEKISGWYKNKTWEEP